MKQFFSFLPAFLLFVTLTTCSMLLAQPVQAQECSYTNQCINNRRCTCLYSTPICFLTSNPCGSAIIGEVKAPQGVAEYNQQAGGEIGLFKFVSKIINVASIVGGIMVMWNFLSAGLTYTTSAGNSGTYEKVRDKITWGLVGLAVIASFYLITALIGTLFYGNSTAVLNPGLGTALPK